jgi:oleandomycin transport system permease protein
MTGLPTAPPPQRQRARTVSAARCRRLLRHSAALCRRTLWQLRGEPLQALDVVMPMIIGLVFLSAFGGAIGRSGTDYTQFLLPGLLVQAVMIVSMATGIGLNQDFGTGLIDRLRALPIDRSAVLVGRIAADLVRTTAGLLLVFGFALVVGLRVDGGAGGAVAALALVLAFGVALCWVSAFIGLVIRSPQTVQSLGFVWMIPLQFGSSLFVPAGTLPDWLRTVVALNPMTLVCDAARGLLAGTDATAAASGALAWTVGITLVFAPAAVRRYARRVL